LIKHVEEDDMAVNNNDLEENMAVKDTPPSTRMGQNSRFASMPDDGRVTA